MAHRIAPACALFLSATWWSISGGFTDVTLKCGHIGPRGGIMADKSQSLGKIVVQGIGGLLVIIAIVYVVMYFLKPEQPPQPPDARFEPNEIVLDKGQSKVIQLMIAPREKDFQVVVHVPSELKGGDLKFLVPGRKKFDFVMKTFDLKVEAEESAKPGAYFIKAGDASCTVTVR
jgi:hypothetical protein